MKDKESIITIYIDTDTLKAAINQAYVDCHLLMFDDTTLQSELNLLNIDTDSED